METKKQRTSIYGKSPFGLGTSTVNEPFSLAMYLDNESMYLPKYLYPPVNYHDPHAPKKYTSSP